MCGDGVVFQVDFDCGLCFEFEGGGVCCFGEVAMWQSVLSGERVSFRVNGNGNGLTVNGLDGRLQ